MWEVWFVRYGTYAEIAEAGDPPAHCVKRGLTLHTALKVAEALGFGYYAKRAERVYR